MNTTWNELCKQVEAVGFDKMEPGIARLAWACEYDGGVNQHAADDIWAVIDELATLRENYTAAADLLAIREEQVGELLAEKAALRARVAELEAQNNLVHLVAAQYAPDICVRQGCNAPATEYRLLRAGAVHLCAEHAAEVAGTPAPELHV